MVVCVELGRYCKLSCYVVWKDVDAACSYASSFEVE